MSKTIERGINFAAARKLVTVPVPELDCMIILRELSVSQLRAIDRDDVPGQLAQMIVDENGARIFTTPEDIANLAEMSATVSTRLILAAARLNGISQAAVDESVKNLLASPSSGSASV